MTEMEMSGSSKRDIIRVRGQIFTSLHRHPSSAHRVLLLGIFGVGSRQYIISILLNPITISTIVSTSLYPNTPSPCVEQPIPYPIILWTPHMICLSPLHSAHQSIQNLHPQFPLSIPQYPQVNCIVWSWGCNGLISSIIIEESDFWEWRGDTTGEGEGKGYSGFVGDGMKVCPLN